jgi:hypothetical protein
LATAFDSHLCGLIAEEKVQLGVLALNERIGLS